VDATEAFFSGMGIPFVEESDGKLYPASLQASAVPKMFQYELKKRGVNLQVSRMIDSVKRKGEGFILITAGKEEHYCDSLILAAGSCAYPSLGSGMSGYEIASSLGTG
jgi:predicted flavoprotein YhiN